MSNIENFKQSSKWEINFQGSRGNSDDSRHTYTAIVFNDGSHDMNQNYLVQRMQSNRYGSNRKITNQLFSNLLKVNSLSRLASSKQIRNSVTIFQNQKLHPHINNQTCPPSRPVSAFIQLKKQLIQTAIKEPNQLKIKNSLHKISRQMSMVGKKCLIEDTESTSKAIIKKDSQKKSQSIKDSKDCVKFQDRQDKQKEGGKDEKERKEEKKGEKGRQMVSFPICFQSLYKNLLINNKAVHNKNNSSHKENINRNKKSKRLTRNSAKGIIQTRCQNLSRHLLIVTSKKCGNKTITNKNMQNQREHKNMSITWSMAKYVKKCKHLKTEIASMKRQELIEPKIEIVSSYSSFGRQDKQSFEREESKMIKNMGKCHSSSNYYSRQKKQNEGQFIIDCKRIMYC